MDNLIYSLKALSIYTRHWNWNFIIINGGGGNEKEA